MWVVSDGISLNDFPKSLGSTDTWIGDVCMIEETSNPAFTLTLNSNPSCLVVLLKSFVVKSLVSILSILSE